MILPSRMLDYCFMFQCSGCKMFHLEHQNTTEDALYKRVVKCLLWQKKKKKLN